MRAVRRMAFASMVISLLPGLLVAAMTLERTGQGELAKLVANHVLVDQDRDVVLAVMHGDGETHHFRHDHRTTRPGLDRLLVLARLVTLGRHTPRGDRMRITLAGLRLATTVRVVDRVHGGAADGRLDAAPALRTCLAQ